MEINDMERFMQVLWSIHARLEEIEELVKTTNNGPTVVPCEKSADGWCRPVKRSCDNCGHVPNDLHCRNCTSENPIGWKLRHFGERT